MRVVTRRTGLSADLLRAWERRHAVVEPSRSANGHRLYSDLDIERLRLLYRATIAGRGIGQVAELPTKLLAALVRQDESPEFGAERRPSEGTRPGAPRARVNTPVDAVTRSESAAEFLADCLRAIEHLNAAALAGNLRRASVALSATEFLDELVVPLLRMAGTGWRQGTLPPVHGHLTRVVLRRSLDSAIADASSPASTASVVVGTPVGELQEFDALLAALSAAIEGWHVTYLGTNLSADHVAEAATLTRAKAVALSVEHPKTDPGLRDEFRRLRRALSSNVMLIVVGSASASYGAALDEIGAVRPLDLAGFRSQLRLLRRARRRDR
jgi:DNA-binding transcriptional MerR regulator